MKMKFCCNSLFADHFSLILLHSKTTVLTPDSFIVIYSQRRNSSDVTGVDIKLARNACHAPFALSQRDILQIFTSSNISRNDRFLDKDYLCSIEAFLF